MDDVVIMTMSEQAQNRGAVEAVKPEERAYGSLQGPRNSASAGIAGWEGGQSVARPRSVWRHRFDSWFKTTWTEAA